MIKYLLVYKDIVRWHDPNTAGMIFRAHQGAFFGQY